MHLCQLLLGSPLTWNDVEGMPLESPFCVPVISFQPRPLSGCVWKSVLPGSGSWLLALGLPSSPPAHLSLGCAAQGLSV